MNCFYKSFSGDLALLDNDPSGLKAFDDSVPVALIVRLLFELSQTERNFIIELWVCRNLEKTRFSLLQFAKFDDLTIPFDLELAVFNSLFQIVGI